MKKRKKHSPEFKAKVALKAIREEMTLAELSKKSDRRPSNPDRHLETDGYREHGFSLYAPRFGA